MPHRTSSTRNDYEQKINYDWPFFFKLSSARREDYASLENVMNVVAQYAKRYVETQWLSMKYVALCLLEQWPNLKEYFLNFLPK